LNIDNSMKTVAILSQKGGAGKTTIAVNLAVAAAKSKKVAAIVDLDPQGSAFGWGDARNVDEPAIISAQSIMLPQIMDNAHKADADLILIDTSPHSQNSALEAAKVSDLVLIPCRPAILDLRAIGNSIEIAKLANRPACVVLNAVPPRGTLNEQAREAIQSYGVKIAPIELGQRMAFAHSMTDSLGVQEYEPRGKAAKEIGELYKWLLKELNI